MKNTSTKNLGNNLTMKPIRRKAGRPKASALQKRFQYKVCLWLALGMTNTQIVDRAKERLDVKTTKQNIDTCYRYGKKWQKTIAYFRDRYLRNLSHMPIANKEKRIAMLQDLYKEAMTWRVKTKTAYGSVKEIKIGVALQAIEAARREIEGDKGINLSINNDNRKFQSFQFSTKSGEEIAEFLTQRLKNRG